MLRDDVVEENGIDARVEFVNRFKQFSHVEVPLAFDVVVTVNEGQKLVAEILLSEGHGLDDGTRWYELTLIVL